MVRSGLPRHFALVAITLALTCSTGLAKDGRGKSERHSRLVLRVALVGDPQVDNATEMWYARKSIYRELAKRKDLDLCLLLGDLVNDSMPLLPESLSIIDSLPFPCFLTPGNHDRDVYRGRKASGNEDRPRDLVTWRRAVGYVDTSFVRGNVRFIMMNNVRHSEAGMTDYEGGFTEMQKHWLDSLLKEEPGDHEARTGRSRHDERIPALTILATHIPFSQMKGRDSVLALIPASVRMLYVSGHTHSVARDDSIPEIIAGAACGSWWRGVKDSEGVPYAMQNCGAPRGYFVMEIRRDGNYKLRYKCIGRPTSEQLSVWAIPCKRETALREHEADASEQGTSKAGSERSYRLYVNVFGGAADGKVTVRCPRRRTCDPSDRTAPEVENIIKFNASMSREYRKEHQDEFIPLRRKSSPHLWQSRECLTYPLPEYVRVIYRDSHMKIKQRIRLQLLP